MNLPPVRRAYSQQNSAVRAPPTCSSPVGLGAKRVTTVMWTCRPVRHCEGRACYQGLSRYARREVHMTVVTRFAPDRKSTRLNSSHLVISYAVFCLQKTTLTSDRRERSCSAHSRPPHRRDQARGRAFPRGR